MTDFDVLKNRAGWIHLNMNKDFSEIKNYEELSDIVQRYDLMYEALTEMTVEHDQTQEAVTILVGLKRRIDSVIADKFRELCNSI